MKNLVIGVVVSSIVFIFLGWLLVGREKPVQTFDMAITSTDYQTNASASAVLVEYSDFQCPACASYHDLVSQLKADLGDRINIVYRHFPLRQIHKNAQLAGQAAESANIQGKFWEMHDLLYEKQDEWGNLVSPLSREQVLTYFQSYAGQLGLDINKFTKAIETNEAINIINEDISAGTASGVNATPTFYVNNTKISEPSFAAIKKEIDRVLQK